jgi:hypothetical protein
VTGLRALRVRKARAWSVCRLCPALIQVGNLIGKLPSGGWAHASCIIAAQRAEQAGAEQSRDAQQSAP